MNNKKNVLKEVDVKASVINPNRVRHFSRLFIIISKVIYYLSVSMIYCTH